MTGKRWEITLGGWIEMKTLIDFTKNLKSFYRLYKDYEYNGAECEFIIENYQEVLCSRTKTMSKPTYYAGDVISQLDDWYSDHAEWPRMKFYLESEEMCYVWKKKANWGKFEIKR